MKVYNSSNSLNGSGVPITIEKSTQRTVHNLLELHGASAMVEGG